MYKMAITTKKMAVTALRAIKYKNKHHNLILSLLSGPKTTRTEISGANVGREGET